MPETEETHKDILFTDWDARIKQAELVVARETRVEKNIIKTDNHTFHTTNLIKEGNPKSLLDLKDLDKNWKEKMKIQREAIMKLSKTNWEAYRKFLVKPHSQIMTLNCSLNSTQRTMPLLTGSIFAGQFKTQFVAPPQVKPMSDVCNLKEKLTDIKTFS